MDSFSTASFFAAAEDITVPTPQEHGDGNNGGGYCVIA
jgi:hypothetical protein